MHADDGAALRQRRVRTHLREEREEREERGEGREERREKREERREREERGGGGEINSPSRRHGE